MRICHISDTHGIYNNELESGDLLIHSGDGLLFGKLHEVYDLAKWFKWQDYRWKIFVPGNHDIVFEHMYPVCKKIMGDAGVIVLKNESFIDSGILGLNVRIWGSPYTKEFMNWAFMLPESKLALIWDTIPKGTDIVITHGPPNTILDNCSKPGDPPIHAGSVSLLNKILEIRPKYHLFGHIHVSKGYMYTEGINFYNSSVVRDTLELNSEPNYFNYEE